MAAGLSYASFYINNFRGHANCAVGSSFAGTVPLVRLTADTLMDAYRQRRERLSIRKIIHAAVDGSKPAEMVGESGKQTRLYKFNKSMLFKRAMAFSMLRDSDRFLAFYTMSFPVGTPDDVCYKVWNIVLTRMRKVGYLRGYLWVCERQRNGTCHFHMLSNTYAPIRLVNRMAAAAIETCVSHGECTWGNSSYRKFNGMDVKRVKYNRKTISVKSELEVRRRVCSYLSKYISKSEQVSTRRLWHCSREVSALFVSATVSEEEVLNMVASNPEMLNGRSFLFQGDGVCYVGVPIPESYIWYYLTRINELVYRLATKTLKS